MRRIMAATGSEGGGWPGPVKNITQHSLKASIRPADVQNATRSPSDARCASANVIAGDGGRRVARVGWIDGEAMSSQAHTGASGPTNHQDAKEGRAALYVR